MKKIFLIMMILCCAVAHCQQISFVPNYLASQDSNVVSMYDFETYNNPFSVFYAAAGSPNLALVDGSGVSQDAVKFRFGAASMRLQDLFSFVPPELGGGAEEWNFKNEDFTVEYWFNAENVSTTSGVYTDFRVYNEYQNNRYRWLWILRFQNNPENTVLFFQNYTAGNASQTIVAPGIRTDWHHIALVRNDDYLNWYLDGISVASAAWSADLDAPFVTGGCFVSFVEVPNVNESYINIDEMRISKEAKYLGNFTPNPQGLATITAKISIAPGGKIEVTQ